MNRRIELVSAFLACVAGLVWVVYLVSALQSVWFTGFLNGSGAGPRATEPLTNPGTVFYFGSLVLVLVLIAAGAYLHAVQRVRAATGLLGAGALLLTLALALYTVEPWRVVPLTFVYLVQGVIASWMTPLAVFSIVCAWVAFLATLPVREIVPPLDVPDSLGTRVGAQPHGTA